MLTPVMKQYMKKIYTLADSYDEVIPLNVANALGVSSSAVSRMAKKLAAQGLILYEYYGKITLTKEGKLLGQMLMEYHKVLEQFTDIVGIKETRVLEEIEFKLCDNVIDRIQLLNQYFMEDQSRIKAFNDFCNR